MSCTCTPKRHGVSAVPHEKNVKFPYSETSTFETIRWSDTILHTTQTHPSCIVKTEDDDTDPAAVTRSDDEIYATEKNWFTWDSDPDRDSVNLDRRQWQMNFGFWSNWLASNQTSPCAALLIMSRRLRRELLNLRSSERSKSEAVTKNTILDQKGWFPEVVMCTVIRSLQELHDTERSIWTWGVHFDTRRSNEYSASWVWSSSVDARLCTSLVTSMTSYMTSFSLIICYVTHGERAHVLQHRFPDSYIITAIFDEWLSHGTSVFRSFCQSQLQVQSLAVVLWTLNVICLLFFVLVLLTSRDYFFIVFVSWVLNAFGIPFCFWPIFSKRQLYFHSFDVTLASRHCCHTTDSHAVVTSAFVFQLCKLLTEWYCGKGIVYLHFFMSHLSFNLLKSFLRLCFDDVWSSSSYLISRRGVNETAQWRRAYDLMSILFSSA